MSEKTYVPEGEVAPSSQIATTIEALAATIRARRDAGEESYTHQLLYGPADKPLKKVMEEAGEVGARRQGRRVRARDVAGYGAPRARP